MTQDVATTPLNLFGQADDTYLGSNEDDITEEVPEDKTPDDQDDENRTSAGDDLENQFHPDDGSEDIAGDGLPAGANEFVKAAGHEPNFEKLPEDKSTNKVNFDADALARLNLLLDDCESVLQQQRQINSDTKKLIEALYDNNQKFNGNLDVMHVVVKNHIDTYFKDYFDNVVKNFNAMKKASFVWYKNMDNEKSKAAKTIYSSAKLVPYATALLFACLVAIIIKR